jgi:ABC-type glutathione transport system ATPase component
MRRRMAMVFQDPYSSLDPRYTWPRCWPNPSAVQASPAAGNHARNAGEVGLPEAWPTAIRTSFRAASASGRHRPRAGAQPDFVVLDEPTASLTCRSRRRSSRFWPTCAPAGLTYLFISHDLGLVRYFCDRIVVMYLGAVVEVLPDPAAPPAPPLYPAP